MESSKWNSVYRSSRRNEELQHQQHEEQPSSMMHPRRPQRQQPFEAGQQRRNQEKGTNKWYTTFDVQEFRQQEIKAKVDPIYHTLTISAKRHSQPWSATEQEQCRKMKRVLPLPENVDVEQLRVKLLPYGELLVKAPYQRRTDGSTALQYKRSGAAPIPVSFKHVGASLSSSSPREQQLQQGQGESRLDQNVSVQRFLRLLKHSAFPNTLDAQCVHDEATGQWKVLFDVNTVGFRPDEVRVHFQEKERLLLVEAKHELRHTEATEQYGVSMKTLRREFLLPEWLDGEQMRYRVMKNGVLRIQVPCLRNPCPMKSSEQDRQQLKWQQQQQQQQQPEQLKKEQH